MALNTQGRWAGAQGTATGSIGTFGSMVTAAINRKYPGMLAARDSFNRQRGARRSRRARKGGGK